MTMHGRSDASAPTSPAGRIVSRGDGLPERLSFTRAGTLDDGPTAIPSDALWGRLCTGYDETHRPTHRSARPNREAGAVSAIADHSSAVEAAAASQ
jgi:hypothetical protein